MVGKERASSICVRYSEQAEIARNYVESLTEGQCVGEGVDRCEEDIEGEERKEEGEKTRMGSEEENVTEP